MRAAALVFTKVTNCTASKWSYCLELHKRLDEALALDALRHAVTHYFDKRLDEFNQALLIGMMAHTDRTALVVRLLF